MQGGIVHGRVGRRIEFQCAAPGPRGRLSPISCHDIDGALVGAEPIGFGVRTIARVAAVPGIELHGRNQSGRKSIVPVEQVGAFVAVAVAGQNEIHSARLQDGQDVLPHFDQFSFRVGIMRALGVRWVVPESDDPVLYSRSQIGLQPGQHRTARLPRGRHGIEGDEMNAAVIEGIIFLRAGRSAAGLSVGGEIEDLKVGNRERGVRQLGGLVIADRRPEDGLTQKTRIHVEHRRLEFRVRTGVVCIVAQHQPHIGPPSGRKGAVAVPHGRRRRVCRTGITEDPDPGWFCRARGGGGNKIVFRSADPRSRCGADAVEILGVRAQARDLHRMFRRQGGIIRVYREAARGGSYADPAVAGNVRPPAHHDAVGGAGL